MPARGQPTGERYSNAEVVGACPDHFPPGTLDALKCRRPTPAPQPPSVSRSNDLTSGRRHARISAESRARKFAHAQAAATPATAHLRGHI